MSRRESSFGTWVWVTLGLMDGGPALKRPCVYVGIGVGERVVGEQARALLALILPTTSEVFVQGSIGISQAKGKISWPLCAHDLLIFHSSTHGLLSCWQRIMSTL